MPQTDPLAASLLPSLVEHAALINAMDDKLNHQYMFGENGTSTWVAPWQPSELSVIDRCGALAGISAADVVADLGCGDGRVLIRLATTLRSRGLGWDVSEDAVACAQTLSAASGVASLLEFDAVDFTLPLTDARRMALQRCSVVFLYLVHHGLRMVRPLLEGALAVNPALKVITNTYHFDDGFMREIARDDGDVVRVWQGVI